MQTHAAGRECCHGDRQSVTSWLITVITCSFVYKPEHYRYLWLRNSSSHSQRDTQREKEKKTQTERRLFAKRNAGGQGTALQRCSVLGLMWAGLVVSNRSLTPESKACNFVQHASLKWIINIRICGLCNDWFYHKFGLVTYWSETWTYLLTCTGVNSTSCL